MLLYLTDPLGQGNGQSAAKQLAGSYQITYSGVFGGASIVLQVSIDGTTWIDVDDTTKTAPATFALDIGHGHVVRVSITGGTGTNVVAVAGTIPFPVTNAA